MAKIIIDPGHGGSDPGAVYGVRREKDDVLRLGLAVGKILENARQDVTYTRVSDVFNTPYEKAVMGNNSNADFFISLHRNNANPSNIASGVEALVFEDSGIRSNLARHILKNLEEIGFQNRGVIERPNLVVLRRTKMPAVAVEVGFIDNDSDNKRFDLEFDQTANAIAQGILDTINGQKIPQETNIPNKMQQPLYRVQVGVFRNYQNAANYLNKLQEEGYPAFMLYQNGLYRVQVGAYELLDNAIRMEQRLRNSGYNTLITSS